MSKQILMVVTSHAMSEQIQTGLCLEEYAIPYLLFDEQSYRITTKSIAGGNVPLEPDSMRGTNVNDFEKALAQLKNTEALQSTDTHYDAIFLAGGHGAIFDFPRSNALQIVISAMAEEKKIIGSVCHGAAGLLTATYKNGKPIIQDKKVTAFTNEEENELNMTDKLPFLLESELNELGAQFVRADKWQSFAAVDRQFVTGQNPQSSRCVAEMFIDELDN